MLSRVHSLAPHGIEVEEVLVECQVQRGLPNFTVVGLPDAAVQESRERVRSALTESGYEFPMARITVALAPASMRKTGSLYDLPVAIALLIASGQITPQRAMEDFSLIGELSLDGKLRHVQGAVSMGIGAAKKGVKAMIAPEAVAKELAVCPLEVYPAESLQEVVSHITNREPLQKQEPVTYQDLLRDQQDRPPEIDFVDIRGQEHAKRALEIAAAGGHNLLMNGAPGAGKTLMAQALQGILPPLSESEALELAKIYSVAGELNPLEPIVISRPYRAVHHTASPTSVIGGGSVPRPGEISLAHGGVLFLDELPEFPSITLEVLRQPLETRKVLISRAQSSEEFPANVMLIAAMNPCPCGYSGVAGSDRECTCSSHTIERYRKRISGPLLDRIDLYVDIPPVKYERLMREQTYEESSSEIRQRVRGAWERQISRARRNGMKQGRNSSLSIQDLQKVCKLAGNGSDLLKMASEQFRLSARGVHRVLKVARTIADLEGSQEIQPAHVAEAVQYRPKHLTLSQ